MTDRPRFTNEMIKEIGAYDPQLALKIINDHLEHIYDAIDGHCRHIPSRLVAKALGDFQLRADGSTCIYCSKQIEISEIRWRLRNG